MGDDLGQADQGLQGEAEHSHVRLLESLLSGLAELSDQKPDASVANIVKLLVGGGLRD